MAEPDRARLAARRAAALAAIQAQLEASGLDPATAADWTQLAAQRCREAAQRQRLEVQR